MKSYLKLLISGVTVLVLSMILLVGTSIAYMQDDSFIFLPLVE